MDTNKFGKEAWTKPQLRTIQQLRFHSRVAVDSLDNLSASQASALDSMPKPELSTMLKVIPSYESGDRDGKQLNDEVNTSLLTSRSSYNTDCRDNRYGSVQAPNRNSNYHEEEIDEETYDASESNRFLFHSKEPSISENRDSVHTNFYGRMNQALHEGRAISARRHAQISGKLSS